MKIINFSVTTVANWMVYFYYMKTQCYKLKLFIFNASEKHFHPVAYAKQPLRIYSLTVTSILYGLKEHFCFYYVDSYLKHILRWKKQPHLFSAARVNSLGDFADLILISVKWMQLFWETKNIALGSSDKLHWHNIDWWYRGNGDVFSFVNFSFFSFVWTTRFNKSQLKMLFLMEKGFAGVSWLIDLNIAPVAHKESNISMFSNQKLSSAVNWLQPMRNSSLKLCTFSSLEIQKYISC